MALQSKMDKELAVDSIRSLNVRLSGNLSRFKYDNFSYIVNLHNAYEAHGLLPYPGSYSEQPATIIEIFNVIDHLMFERRDKMHKESQKEVKKNV